MSKRPFSEEAWQDAKGSVTPYRKDNVTRICYDTLRGGGVEEKTVTRSTKAELKTGALQLFGDINVWRQLAKKEKKKNQ